MNRNVSVYFFCPAIYGCFHGQFDFRWRNGQYVEGGSHIRRPEGRRDPLQLDRVVDTRGWRPGDGVEDAVVGLDAVAAQVERPVHGKENVVVHHVGLVVGPGLRGVERDDIDDFGNAEATATIRPDDLQKLASLKKLVKP